MAPAEVDLLIHGAAELATPEGSSPRAGAELDRVRVVSDAAVAVAEVFALTAEAAWLRAFGVRAPTALLVSLLANGTSFSAGLFCYRALGW